MVQDMTRGGLGLRGGDSGRLCKRCTLRLDCSKLEHILAQGSDTPELACNLLQRPITWIMSNFGSRSLHGHAATPIPSAPWFSFNLCFGPIFLLQIFGSAASSFPSSPSTRNVVAAPNFFAAPSILLRTLITLSSKAAKSMSSRINNLGSKNSTFPDLSEIR